jgi:small GTP-binding protein
MPEKANAIRKLCLIGAESVGKTSLIKRFILNIFDDKYLRTLGTKVSKKVVEVEHPDKDVQVNLTMLIWDIMGQDTFRPLLQDSYFYGAAGGLAVFDLTRKETLTELEGWIESLRNIAGNIPIVVLANKNDLEDQIQVDKAELDEFASKHNLPTYYSSAKTGESVQEGFIKIGKMMTENI